MRMEAGIAVTQPQAKDHLGLPELGEARQDPLKAFEGGTALLTP